MAGEGPLNPPAAEMDRPAASLWKHSDFLKFWAGQTISVFGTSISNLALPLAAVNTLKASASQMGLYEAAGTLPFLLVGLFAGVWIDRNRRRPLMLAADLGRGVLLGLIPIALLAGVLRMELLYVISFLTGTLSVFFDVSYQAFLPALVSREKLVEGNSKLEISSSSANIVGPGLAGWLVQALGAPFAIALDAVSYLVSAFTLSIIHTDEPAPTPHPEAQRGIWKEIREGLGVVFGNRVLWAIAGATATSNFFGMLWGSIYIILLTRDLHFTPAEVGIIFAAGAPGALVASLVVTPLTRRLGLGPAIIAGMGVNGLAGLVILVGSRPGLPGMALLFTGGFLVGFGAIFYNINQVSLRQSITPDRLLGRMNASMRFLVWGTLPLGGFAASGLSILIGVWPTIMTGLLGMLLAVLWLFFSPLRKMKEQPPPA